MQPGKTPVEHMLEPSVTKVQCFRSGQPHLQHFDCTGRLSNSQKDEIEGQVAALVKASRDSLQGLQKYVNSPGAVAGPGSSQAIASKDAIAHRQGVVGSPS